MIPFRLWLRGIPKKIKENREKLSTFSMVSPDILTALGYYAPNQEYYAGPPGNVDSKYSIKEQDVDSYFQYHNYVVAFSVWHKFSINMGFPFSGGWAEQPFWISEMIALFENAYNEEQSHKYSKDKSNKPGLSNNSVSSNIRTFKE